MYILLEVNFARQPECLFVCKVKVYTVLGVVLPLLWVSRPLVLVLSQWILVLSEIAKELVLKPQLA